MGRGRRAAARRTTRAASLQAWKAGAETAALRRQLEAMPDGGVFAIVIPEAPYRCPPGPYERACQVASYFKSAKPRAKVLVLDANEDVTSKGPLFRKVWAEQYPGMIEYRPQHKAVAVEATTNTVRFEFQDDVRADVLNVLPPMRAGAIAVQTGLATANGRWCERQFPDFESTAAGTSMCSATRSRPRRSCPRAATWPTPGQGRRGGDRRRADRLADRPGADAHQRLLQLRRRRAAWSTSRASTHGRGASRRSRRCPARAACRARPNETEGRYAWNWAHTIWADMLA